ncbi:angiotensin-converting enzyme-like protein Ace3 [Eriocheir sinensis]|uniref:angiotensin-converting enzyme-like protein Ace3 n=1 Tax=Eriocheir sinensis TaxID=95602 RepID=UPI0021C56E25|nr:angiotensin-converting enzyme-like protein Ace3 [Eriocheir sinensis]
MDPGTDRQILESLCEAAGHKGPLHACDLYGSEAAGRKLAEAMRLGASRAWPEVLQGLTGADHITGEPLKRYFRPLTDWLTEDALTAGLGGGLGWGASWRLPDERGGAVRERAWQGVRWAVLLQVTRTLTDRY